MTTLDVDGLPSPVRLDPDEFAGTWILSPGDCFEFYDEPTLLRMLFNFYAHINIAAANVNNNYGANVFAGWIVTDGDDPAGIDFKNVGDSTQQWVWWYNTFLFHRANALIGTPFVSLGATQKTGFMDLKTRRKIPEGFGLAAIVWNSDFIGSDFTPTSIDFFSAGRILFNDH